MLDWIEIFKTGTHTDSAGNVSTWTEEDLDAVVEQYNNQPEGERHEAPIVIGHPVTNGPAYGWIKSLKRDGDKLYAMPKQVDPGFEQLLEQGSFKKKSASFYPANKLLRHVGFLGAMPPAIKGMADVKPVGNFSEWRSGTVAFAEFVGEDPVADTPVDTTSTATNSLTEANVRAAKFGIAVKSMQSVESEERRNNLATPEPAVPTKPGIYESLTDEQFGDPTNYLFPLHTKAAVIVSINTFGTWRYRELYTPLEYQTIATRIVEAGLAQGLTEEERKGWDFVEVPPEMLNKKQLVDILNGNTGQPPQQSTPKPQPTTNLEESTMDPRTAFLAALVAFVSETFTAEVASQIEVKGNELIAASPVETPPDTTANEAPAEGEGQHAETPYIKQLKAQAQASAEKIAALEKKDRMNEHNSFCESLISEGKLTPANKDAAMALLEQTTMVGGELSFSENGKPAKKPTSDFFKSFLQNLPVVVSYGEQANPKRRAMDINSSSDSEIMNFTEESGDVDSQVEALIKKQKEMGVTLTYSEAFRIYTNNRKGAV